MFYNAKKIILEDLASVIIKKSEDEHIHVISDSMEEIKITCTEGKLSICGIPTNEAFLDYAGVTTKRSRSGGISVSNVSGKNVSIINSQVWIDGKLVSGVGKDVPASKPTIVHIPDGVSLIVEACNDVQILHDCNLKEVVLKTKGAATMATQAITCDEILLSSAGQSKIEVGKITSGYSFTLHTEGQSTCRIDSVKCKAAAIVGSDQSKVKIDYFTALGIDIQTNGTTEVRIKHADIGKSQFQTNGQSKVKVEGLLTEVVAHAQGQSSCKFSTPRNQPFMTKKGQSTCKAI